MKLIAKWGGPFFLIFGIAFIFTFQNCAPSGSGNAFVLGTGSNGSENPGQGPLASPSPNPSPTPVPSKYTTAVLNDKPKYYWKLNAAAGGTSQPDLSGGNTGTGQGSFTFGVTGGLIGDTDTALSLAPGGYVSTAMALPFPNSISMEIWFKTSQQGRIMGWGSSQTGASAGTEYNLYINSLNFLTFAIAVTDGVNTAPVFIQTANSPKNDGAWHHTVATYDGTTMVLYLDGAMVGTPFKPGFPIISFSGNWRIGPDDLAGYTNAPANPSYTGSLDEAAIYDSILTLKQVQSHYNAGLNH